MIEVRGLYFIQHFHFCLLNSKYLQKKYMLKKKKLCLKELIFNIQYYVIVINYRMLYNKS